MGRMTLAVVWLVSVAAAAQAADFTAYSWLLASHVRPGTVAGIRLNMADYRGIQADPHYPKALDAFARAAPGRRQTPPSASPSGSTRTMCWPSRRSSISIR